MGSNFALQISCSSPPVVQNKSQNEAATRNMIADGFATVDPDVGKLSGRRLLQGRDDAATKLAR
jgi:hypothetical protein